MNPIVPQSARDFRTPPPVPVSVFVPVLLLPAPKSRLMLSAPRIAGLLPAAINTPIRLAPGITRITVASEAVSIIDHHWADDEAYDDCETLLDVYERRFGRFKTPEEYESELAERFLKYDALRQAFYAKMEKAMGVAL